MESLPVRAVVVIELVREKQAEVFVPPRQATRVRGQLVHLILKLSVVFIDRLRRKRVQQLHALEQLVTMSTGDLDGIFNGDIVRIV